MKFEKHIFICTNEREEGARKSCGAEHGMSLVREFKRLIKVHGIEKTNMRAQRAGCLDACDTGPTVVVYPEGIYYGNVQLKDVEEIVVSHLKNNVPVVRLIIK